MHVCMWEYIRIWGMVTVPDASAFEKQIKEFCPDAIAR